MLMLTNFTNKCNNLVHNNIKFMQIFNMLISQSLQINVITYGAHINIKLMQKLKHAHAH